MTQRLAALASLAVALILSACGDRGAKPQEPLNFSILSAESEQSMAPLWQPVIDDLSKAIGRPVKPFYGANYTALVEAMRFDQVQLGWFSAFPALEATRRAQGEVISRVVDSGGAESYNSVLIVRAGSGITLDDVLKCGRRYTFGIGDAKSTTGTLAPMAYLFTPRGIDPSACFKTVRSASHEANVFGVAKGVLDVATNNTVGLFFAGRRDPALRAGIEVIWQSPPLPESSIVVRQDMDPQLKDKVRRFFVGYGTQPGPEGDRQRQVLKGLAYGGFRAADNSYLDAIRHMEAAQALAEARRSGDQARIAEAQKALDAVAAGAR